MTLIDTLSLMIRNTLMTMHISSAGGDSPKVNYVRDLDMHTEEYENLLELEVEKKVKEILGLQVQDTSPLTQKKPKKGTLMQILERDLGTSKAVAAIALLSNPLGTVGGIVSSVIRMAGSSVTMALMVALAGPMIAKKLAEVLTRRGGFGDLTFRNIIDDRINVLRSRESQQEIRRGIEGNAQLILTTRAGTVNPIFSYNTYEQINNNILEFERLRAIRSTTNIP